ncbi:hypothetical protein C6P40_002853 [Pichia californica]|uniref:PPM-type phosphatase domain-containing protein n=1 Tax=Pichia californica TaxID=460514 RepID=A0A9P6WI01_9ASCO|nr:hypothetical protein C6P40_002853 [[Candida] californica]
MIRIVNKEIFKSSKIKILNRKISQHLTIDSTNSKSPINFQVNLLKVPSNFGYYSGRVNRPYNEDRWQTSILDLRPETLKIDDNDNNDNDINNDDIMEGFSNFDFDNKKLVLESRRIKEPIYNLNSPPIDRTLFSFGIFDGHGGIECSNYLKNHLFENIEKFNLTNKSFIEINKFFNLKISGYWKRLGRKFGDVMINECNIENVIKKYVDKINREHQIKIKEQDEGEGEVVNDDNDHDYDDDVEQLIDWEDIRNGKELWNIIEMMIKDNKLSHWEIFKIRIWLSYLFTDIQFLTWENENNQILKKKLKIKEPKEIQERLINSGSTCTSCFIYAVDWNKEDRNHYFYQDNVVSRLLIGHIGDTRLIICDKFGIGHSLTKDHHPSNPIEAKRLRKFSSGLIMTDSFGEERFLNFANTRSFGDLSAKDLGISSEPEISDYLIGNSNMIKNFKNNLNNKEILKDNKILDFGGDESFIVLISDGVTNNLSDQEIVDIIKTNYNNKGIDKGNPSKCAEEVIEFVECIGGDDNATCLVIRLGGWGKWPIEDITGKLREERMMDIRYNR